MSPLSDALMIDMRRDGLWRVCTVPRQAKKGRGHSSTDNGFGVGGSHQAQNLKSVEFVFYSKNIGEIFDFTL